MCCVPVNGKTTFNVNYAPVDVSPPDPNNAGQQLPDTVKIEVTSNTYSNPLPSVAVSGTGVLQTCPIAKIDVKGEAVYRVRVKGTQAGDMKFRVQVSCDQIRTPISKEENTRFYKN